MSASESAGRVRIGLFVEGEIVVRVSADIFMQQDSIKRITTVKFSVGVV